MPALVLPVSHRRGYHSAPGPVLPFGARAEAQRAKIRLMDRNKKRLAVKAPEAPVFRSPPDNQIRALASMTAKDRENKPFSSRISRFDRVMKVYAQQMLGYSDRGRQLEELIYLRLKECVNLWREQQRYMKPTIIMRELEDVAARIWKTFETEILEIAVSGRWINVESVKHYRICMVRLGLHAKRDSFFVIQERLNKPFRIIALKNSRQFSRRKRRGINKHSPPEYRNNTVQRPNRKKAKKPHKSLPKGFLN